MQAIHTARAPQPVGPYSQAISACGFVFVSGQVAIAPGTNKLMEGSIAEQARQILLNISSILEAAGSNLSNVVKTTIFLRHMSDFADVNAIYAEFFPGTKPARATVEVSRLPGDALLEIEAVALAG